MKKLFLPLTAWLGLASLCTGLFTLAVSAATTPTPATPSPAAGQALEIAPPVINISANPGQTVTTQIKLRDVSTSKLLVKGQVNDFVAAGEDGTPKLLLEEGEESPYSMKTWIAPLPQLTLEPRQVKDLPVVINVPVNAAPGGYYGVIRFTATAPELQDTGVSLSASLGSLVLLRVNGAAKEGLEIAEFSMNNGGKSSTLFESTPVKFVERLKNTGNIHEQPAGRVTITDMFGNKVATVNVNLPPRNILPASIRKFEQNLDSSVIGSKVLFGRYTANLLVTYGSNKQTVSSSIVFWIIPWRLIIAVVIGLVVAFFVLRFAIKRYNQRIIERSHYSRRRR
jgi:hypothetical protein